MLKICIYTGINADVTLEDNGRNVKIGLELWNRIRNFHSVQCDSSVTTVTQGFNFSINATACHSATMLTLLITVQLKATHSIHAKPQLTNKY